MPRYERSNFGCWTCRVRKKKCDEVYPICAACKLRDITCHGYGPKPGWIDGSTKEKAVVEDLKCHIKENRKTKRSESSISAPSYATPSSLPDVGEGGSPAPTSLVGTQHPPNKPSHFRFNPYCPLNAGEDSLPSPPESGLERNHEAPLTEQDKREFETTLLMNYLDNVFPLQFNCYVPPATELGRGWLLALLTRTKPLFHAALALSAYTMHTILKKSQPARIRCINNHWEEMKRHHALAFKELQLQIAGLRDCGTLTSTIETVAGIFQLISFELLRGGTDSWQIHLSAAASLVPNLASHLASSSFAPMHPSRLLSHPQHLAAPTTSHLTCSQPGGCSLIPVSNDAKPSNDIVACNFLVGTIVWFDILSSASTYSPHHLPDNTTYLTTHHIQLENIMGCENWVMINISRISSLASWKSEQQAAGCLSLRDLISRGEAIERELNEGLAMNKESIGEPVLKPETEACQRLGVSPSKSTLVITRIFACSALTYLHTTISGAHTSLPELQDSVCKTIAAFQMLHSPVLLRNLVWPFCVTGCMADNQHEEFFRNGMKLAVLQGEGCPGNLWKAWDIVQECWGMRQAQDDATKGVDWVAAMDKLGFRVLLV